MNILSRTKSVFSAPLILLKSIKKIKINNFLGGLILGALFSLMVNFATVQIQEIINKQRVLEAIENEILNNLVMANNVIEANNKNLKNNTKAIYLYSPKKYSRDLWEQSGQPLLYTMELDRKIQNMISIYYSFTIPASNILIDKIDNFTQNKLTSCYFTFTLLTSDEAKKCDLAYGIVLRTETLPAEWISKSSFELLKVFHPTRDRLNNIFLRIMMGDQSTRPLADK